MTRLPLATRLHRAMERNTALLQRLVDRRQARPGQAISPREAKVLADLEAIATKLGRLMADKIGAQP